LLLPRPVTCGSCESHGSIIVWVAFLETFATVSNFDLHRGIENVLQTFLRFVNNLVVCFTLQPQLIIEMNVKKEALLRSVMLISPMLNGTSHLDKIVVVPFTDWFPIKFKRV